MPTNITIKPSIGRKMVLAGISGSRNPVKTAMPTKTNTAGINQRNMKLISVIGWSYDSLHASYQCSSSKLNGISTQTPMGLPF